MIRISRVSILTSILNLVIFALIHPAFAQTPINCGEVVTGSISTNERFKLYSFTASANDLVTIRADAILGSLDAYLELYSPDGTNLAKANDKIDKTLTTAGTYNIIVRDDYNNETGEYLLTWQRLNNPCNASNISFNQVTSGEIGSVVDIDAYSFTANDNDTITICSAVNTVSSGSFSCYLELYDTTGTRLAYSSGSLKYTFTANGTYYLFVTDYYRDGTGEYKFIILNGDVSCSTIDLEAPRVGFNQPKAGEVVESGSTYAIAWTSSDNVGITSQEIRLSTDSGVTYPTVIASGLGSNIQSYNWSVPADLSSTQARIRIFAQDAQGNIGQDETEGDFTIIKTTLPSSAKDISYEYDKLNRLIKSSLPDSVENTYTYDALGNRLSLNLSGQPSEWTLILPTPWYKEENDYYSAAASCKMVLDYIRQDTTLTQSQIHNYVTAELRNLNPEEIKRIMNHFKPSAYYFDIINKSDIAEAMRDIAHWMDYEVPNTSVPNTPVIIPTFAGYDNWMVVRGVSASQDPNANANPWRPANFTVYGFWLNDPATQGIGENSYKTAEELNTTYYLPLSSADNWTGKYVAITEPPEIFSQAKVQLAKPYLKKLNSHLGDLFKSSEPPTTSLSKLRDFKKQLNQFDWKGIIDPYLLKDKDFLKALKNTTIGYPLKVNKLDSQDSAYYLIPFHKLTKGKDYLTSLVLIVDANDFAFREAAWVKKPVKYLRINKEQAIQLVLKRINKTALTPDNKMPQQIKAELVWKPSSISTSPYKPFWRVSIKNKIWFVTDEGKVIIDTQIKP